MTNVNEMIGKMAEFLRGEAKTETIIGQQFKLGEFTCVPVMSIGMGFGGGGGEGKAEAKSAGEGVGAAGGAGMGMGPVGFLVTRGHDIQFIPASNRKGLSSVFEKLPDLMEKYFEHAKNMEKEEAIKN